MSKASSPLLLEACTTRGYPVSILVGEIAAFSIANTAETSIVLKSDRTYLVDSWSLVPAGTTDAQLRSAVMKSLKNKINEYYDYAETNRHP